MKSKKLLSLLLALAMVMSMAACGAKTNEPPATSGTPSETGAPATEELNWPTKEITLIQPWSLGGGPDSDPLPSDRLRPDRRILRR